MEAEFMKIFLFIFLVSTFLDNFIVKLNELQLNMLQLLNSELEFLKNIC